MKKGVLVLFLLVVSLVGCSKKVYDSHSAQTSLDYKGSYRGVLPCADCEGIETKITLSDESKYVLVTQYLGKDEKEFKSEGTYTWNKEGNTIVLGNEKNGTAKYFVTENTLTALDAKGNKITGTLAEKYVLQKDKDTNEKAVAENVVDAGFAGGKYKLVEMEGMPVVQGQKMCTAQFEKSGRFTAYAGCNNIMGHYQTLNGAVKFGKVAATRMACPDMNTEQQFLKCLDLVTGFAMDESVLYFSKSDGEMVLKFEKIN